MFRPLLLATIALALISGCQTLPKSISAIAGSSTCLSHIETTNETFTAYASGSSLEQAKTNARADLAQQVSSNITSISANKTELNNGRLSEHNASTIHSESKHIPIDQHRIDQTCKSGHSHYVRASLSKAALIASSRSRLQQQIDQTQRNVEKARNASSYERYLSRDKLKRQLDKLIVLDQLLQQYDETYQPNRINKIVDKAQLFIDKNQHLRINITASSTVAPLVPALENALRKAELNYGRHQKNAAIDILLKATPDYKKGNGRHITHLRASLMIRRVDTGELLARISLGEKTGTSTINQSTSMDIALKAMNQNLKRQLQGDKTQLRNKLGII